MADEKRNPPAENQVSPDPELEEMVAKARAERDTREEVAFDGEMFPESLKLTGISPEIPQSAELPQIDPDDFFFTSATSEEFTIPPKEELTQSIGGQRQLDPDEMRRAIKARMRQSGFGYAERRQIWRELEQQDLTPIGRDFDLSPMEQGDLPEEPGVNQQQQGQGQQDGELLSMLTQILQRVTRMEEMLAEMKDDPYPSTWGP